MKIPHKNRKIRIVDTTLRDGEQAPGVVFSSDERLDIARILARTGIDEIEAGIPAMGRPARRDIRRLSQSRLPCMLSSWCRALKADLIDAARCNTQGVHISFPTSSLLLKTMGKDETWVLEQLDKLIPFAQKNFDHVSVGAQDATRTCDRFLSRFAGHVCDAGVRRLRIADTVGMTRPVILFDLIRRLKKQVPDLDLEFHGHNDLGMATANAVTAVDAGAGAVSVTVNGLGERAGNAPLEEVVMALFGPGGYPAQIQTRLLAELCQKVSQASNRRIWPSKPIVGSRIFTHESGIHCAGLLKNNSAYQLFEPSTVGLKGHHFVIGYHSGAASVRHALKDMGISVSKETARRMLPTIRKTARAGKKTLNKTQLETISASASPSFTPFLYNI